MKELIKLKLAIHSVFFTAGIVLVGISGTDIYPKDLVCILMLLITTVSIDVSITIIKLIFEIKKEEKLK